MAISSYEELRDAAVKDGGLFKTDMLTLKDIQGVGRLGRHVRESISHELESHGMGHLPCELPAYQGEEVRLYVLGGTIAEVVRAVTRPNDNGDMVLRGVGDNEAQKVVSKVRDLVCA